MTNLPIKLGDDLNLLNILAQEYQAVTDQSYSYRWQLFSDWYRIFMADKTHQQGSVNNTFNKANNWTSIQQAQQQKYADLQSN